MKKTDLQILVEQAKEGDEKAFADIFEQFYDRIVNYSFRRVLDQDAAQDIAANVFIKVLKNLDRFEWRHEHSFTGWIFRIASNEVNQYLRQTMKYSLVAPEDFELTLKQRDASEGEYQAVENELDQNSQFVALHKAIAKLKPKQQDIIHMHFFEHLSHREIATALDMKEGTVRVSLHRAVAELKKVSKNIPELADVSF